MSLSSPSTGFVGRDAELSAARERLALALSGRPQVLLFAGEPGIGKTRLAEELAAVAAQADARVLWGRCYEGDGAPVFWPWVQLLRGYLTGAQDSSIDSALRRLPPNDVIELARLVPEVRLLHPELPEIAPAADVDQARFRLFDSVTRVLAQGTAPSPLVLLLDDLHWADPPSLLLLEFVARELRDGRILLAGTFRDMEARRGHPLSRTLANLTRLPQVTRLTLAGLPAVSVAQIVAGATGTAPSPALVEGVVERTDGNPLFVIEIARTLPTGDDTLSETLSTVPATVKELIGRRLERLSPACLSVLEGAAVLGRAFEVEVLNKLLGVPRAALLDALAEAERADLIAAQRDRVGGYRFTHVLVRETLYDDLPAAERGRLHRAAGEAIEALNQGDLDPLLAELAWHFAQGALAGADGRALLYAERAAERAMRLLAFEEAVRLLDLALSFARAPEQRAELSLQRGDAQSFAGEMARARESYERAAALARDLGPYAGNGAAQLLARAAAAVSRVAVIVQVDEGRIALLDEALRALGDDDSPLRARLLITLASSLHYGDQVQRRDALIEQGMAMARRCGDANVLAFALYIRSLMLWRPEELNSRLVLADEIAALAEELRSEEAAIEAARLRIVGHLDRADGIGLDAAIEAHARLAAASRQPIHLWRSAMWRTMRALLRGDLAAVQQRIAEAQALAHQARHPDTTAWVAAQLMALRRDQGRLAEVVAPLQGFVTQFPAALAWRATLAGVLAEVGRLDEARREFDRIVMALEGRARGDGFALLPRLAEGLLTASYLAETAVWLNDTAAVARLYAVLLPYAGHGVIVGPAITWSGVVDHRLGLLATALGNDAEARAHLEQALRVYERLDARPWVARAEADLSMLLARAPSETDRARAATLLRQAQASREALALPGVLAGLHAHPPPAETPTSTSPAALPDGLTAREVEVLALIAAGLSNAAIAERLVLSRSTVQNHLINIYRKIDASGRADAAAYAVRRGLALPPDAVER